MMEGGKEQERRKRKKHRCFLFPFRLASVTNCQSPHFFLRQHAAQKSKRKQRHERLRDPFRRAPLASQPLAAPIRK